MRLNFLIPILVVLANLAHGQEYLYKDEELPEYINFGEDESFRILPTVPYDIEDEEFPPIIDPYDDVETLNFGEYPPVIDPYGGNYYYVEGEVPGFYEEFYNTQPSETTELPYYDYFER